MSVRPLPRWGSLARLADTLSRRGTLRLPERGTVEGGQLLPLDPHRPIPGANAWPDDAVLLTYAELRRLVALHIDVCRQSLPRDKPWEWMAIRATAVRDGEAPLLLAEVLD